MAAKYEDLFALPPDVRAEIIHGTIYQLPAPMPRHLRVQSSLTRRLGTAFDDGSDGEGPGEWWIFAECDVQLGDETVRPDVVGWKRTRLPNPDVRPIPVVPDWICEVLSESNVAHDRVTKSLIYLTADVPHYWIIDPVERILEAFALTGGKWTLTGSFDESARTARIAPFDRIELDISKLFLPKFAGGPP